MAARSLDANRKCQVENRGTHRDQGDVMFKWIEAVLAAAAIAGLLTFLTAASGEQDAGPLPTQTATVLKTCTQQPWPYLNCVGPPHGDPLVRLIATGRLGA
jgi:hypothetical protein